MGHKTVHELSPSDVAIRSPLSPKELEKLGLCGSSIRDESSFDPMGAWSRTFRIWGTLGWKRFQTKDMGFLRIDHKAPFTRAGGELHFKQTLAMADGMHTTTEGDIFHGGWLIRQRFFDSAQCPIPELDLEVEGVRREGELRLVTNGKIRDIRFTGVCRTSIEIFALAQSLENDLNHFVLIDDFTKIKPDHSLKLQSSLLTKDASMSACYVQKGWGILPREFWLDAKKKLVMMCTGSVVFEIDPEAETKTFRLLEDLVNGGVHYEY